MFEHTIFLDFYIKTILKIINHCLSLINPYKKPWQTENSLPAKKKWVWIVRIKDKKKIEKGNGLEEIVTGDPNWTSKLSWKCARLKLNHLAGTVSALFILSLFVLDKIAQIITIWQLHLTKLLFSSVSKANI